MARTLTPMPLNRIILIINSCNAVMHGIDREDVRFSSTGTLRPDSVLTTHKQVKPNDSTLLSGKMP
jgi:hypothetical protein